MVVTCNAEEGFKARRWRPGKPLKGAVYYCISTVQDSAPRDDVLPRQAQYLVKTYAVVLDDVGTKVSRETLKGKLPPSFKLRTSMPEGISNEQWVYAFVEGVEPARAAALIEALADAGLTDRGARRADRIMRVPGSLNEKYIPPFATEVLEAHPERLYTFSEVCAGLGVVPSDTPPLSQGPMALPDGMIDPIDAWNHDHDRVTGPINARGWYPVTCPLEHEHTVEVDHGADYKPGLPGIFKCQHEHRGRPPLTTSWYRAWILEQDPDADLALIPRMALEELGSKLAAALGVKPPPARSTGEQVAGGPKLRLVPKDQPSLSEEAYKTLQDQLAGGGIFGPPEDERPLTAGQEAAQAVLDDIIHVASESKFWSLSAKCLLDAKALDNRWYPIMEAVGLLERGKRLPMKPHEWLMQSPMMQRVARITHRLGSPLIVDDCLNLAPAPPEAVPYCGVPALWLELIAFICKGNLDDIEWVLDWCSLVVSDWSEKPGFHLILKGKQGTGKNLAMLPLVTYLQPEHHQLVSTAMIAGQFNAFLTKRLVSVDELKMTTRGAATAHDIYNNLKAWTARGADTLTINEKNMKHFQAADRSCWVITSNEAVPLPIEDDDRRFMVVETPRKQRPKAWYKRVYQDLQAGGHAQVIGWLQARWAAMDEIDRQGLRETAPMTEAKLDLIDSAIEGIDGAVRLAIGGRHGETWPDLMRLEDVINRLKDSPLLTDSMRKNQLNIPRVASALRTAGAVRLFRGESIKHGDRNARIWCLRPQLAEQYEQMGQGKQLLDEYHRQYAGKLEAAFSNVVRLMPALK